MSFLLFLSEGLPCPHETLAEQILSSPFALICRVKVRPLHTNAPSFIVRGRLNQHSVVRLHEERLKVRVLAEFGETGLVYYLLAVSEPKIFIPIGNRSTEFLQFSWIMPVLQDLLSCGLITHQLALFCHHVQLCMAVFDAINRENRIILLT